MHGGGEKMGKETGLKGGRKPPPAPKFPLYSIYLVFRQVQGEEKGQQVK